jgi:hypothetical protein
MLPDSLLLVPRVVLLSVPTNLTVIRIATRLFSCSSGDGFDVLESAAMLSWLSILLGMAMLEATLSMKQTKERIEMKSYPIMGSHMLNLRSKQQDVSEGRRLKIECIFWESEKWSTVHRMMFREPFYTISDAVVTTHPHYVFLPSIENCIVSV